MWPILLVEAKLYNCVAWDRNVKKQSSKMAELAVLADLAVGA